MQSHTTPHVYNVYQKGFKWGLGGWETEACTPPGVLLRYFCHLHQHLISDCLQRDGGLVVIV